MGALTTITMLIDGAIRTVTVLTLAVKVVVGLLMTCPGPSSSPVKLSVAKGPAVHPKAALKLFFGGGGGALVA